MDKETSQTQAKPSFTVFQCNQIGLYPVPVWSSRSEGKALRFIRKMSLLASGSVFRIGG